jgi:hypothetical protein
VNHLALWMVAAKVPLAAVSTSNNKRNGQSKDNFSQNVGQLQFKRLWNGRDRFVVVTRFVIEKYKRHDTYHRHRHLNGMFMQADLHLALKSSET